MPEHRDLSGADLHAPPQAYISGIQYVDVQLTDAQIKALYSNALEIIPAPGPNLMVIVQSAFWYADFTAGAYGNFGGPGGSYASLKLVGDPNGNFDYFTLGSPVVEGPWDQGLTWWVDVVITNAAPQDQNGARARDPVLRQGGVSNWNNQPVAVGIDNPVGAGDLTGGNAANTLSIRVWYSIVPAVPFGAS